MRSRLLVIPLVIAMVMSSVMSALAQTPVDEPDGGGRNIFFPAISAGEGALNQQTDGGVNDAAGQGKGKGLSKHSRELLADATVQGNPTVTLLIAAYPGSNKQVATGIAALGGTIAYRDEDLSYLPRSCRSARREAAARLPGVKYADLNEIIPLDDPIPALPAS